MSSDSLRFAIALALMPLAVSANPRSPQPDPAAAAGVVPAPQYRSSLPGDRPLEEADEQAPNQLWRNANRVVGELAGHGGHLDGNNAGVGSATADRHAGHGAHGHRHGE